MGSSEIQGELWLNRDGARNSADWLRRRALGTGAFRNRTTSSAAILSAGMPASHAALSSAVDSSGGTGFQLERPLAIFTMS